MAGDEVAQVYIGYPGVERMPVKELKAFRRVNIDKGGSATVHFKIPLNELWKWDLKMNTWILYSGEYSIMIGANSRDIKITAPIQIK